MTDPRTERTIAVLVPAWPVLAAGADPDRPTAFTDKEQITAYNALAGAHGVRRGQRVREAQQYCPELEVRHADPVRDARAFEPVILALEKAAVGIEVVRPGLCLLRADRPARYYGDEPKTAAVLRDAVAEVEAGIRPAPMICGIGIADGSFAATLAARLNADEPLIVEPGGSAAFLAPYPVTVLERPELAGILDRLGIRTLGALAALPAADVATRFGAHGVLAHRLAGGLDPRPPAARRPAEDLAVLHEFDPPAEFDEPVVFVAKSLADRLHAILGAAGLAGTRLGVEITTVSGRECARLWRHGDPAGGRLSAFAVAERVRWQLDGWRARDPWPDADPVALLRLIPDQLCVDTGSQQALWGREEVPDRTGRAAERVQAVLGHAGVLRPYLVGGRDPATQSASVPWGDLPEPPADADDDVSWPGAVPPPAPPLVPPESYPAELRDRAGQSVTVSGRARLTGQPARLTVRGETLRVTGWAGPWVYDERWWDPAGHRRRARLQCMTGDGRAWLLAVEGGSWRVEGVYQ
jgi:protein ImuB